MFGSRAGKLITVFAVYMSTFANIFTFIPSNGISGSAECGDGIKIRILIIVGILPPKNDGIFGVALVGNPLCLIGDIAHDGFDQSLVPSGKGVTGAGGD